MPRKTAAAAKHIAEEKANTQRDIPTLVKDSSLVEERRGELVQAAVGLFIRKGYHQTTTREIAREAGVSIGSLYEYIKTKEDVLYLVCEAIHREMEERLTRGKGQGARGQTDRDEGQGVRGKGQESRGELERAIHGYFEVCDEMQDSILLIYRETASLGRDSQKYVLRNESRIAGLFAEILERGAEEGSFQFKDERALGLMAHNIVVMGHMWALRRWALREMFSLEEYTAEQVRLVMGEIAGK